VKIKTITYELPQEKEKVAQIVGMILSNCTWIDGLLTAPRDLYRMGEIAKNTQLLIDHSLYRARGIAIVGSDDVPYESERKDRERFQVHPNLTDIFTKQKLFSSVKFQHAAANNTPEISINTVKELAQHYISKGYMGVISAVDDYGNPEMLRINHHDKTILVRSPKDYDPERDNLEGIVTNLERSGINKIEGGN